MMKLVQMILALAPLALAQLPAPNAAGVSMGHLHLNVKDVEAAKSFFVDQLGATPVKLGNNDVMKFPGALIFLRKADPTGGSDGSVVGHIGFLVRELDPYLAKWKANSVKILSQNMANRQLFPEA